VGRARAGAGERATAALWGVAGVCAAVADAKFLEFTYTIHWLCARTCWPQGRTGCMVLSALERLMSAAAIFHESYFTVRRRSIISLGIGLVAALGLIVSTWHIWLPPLSPGPRVCDSAPIELPHNETSDMPSKSPRQGAVSRTATATQVTLGCSDPVPKHNFR
jgi:hypothetical protein